MASSASFIKISWFRCHLKHYLFQCLHFVIYIIEFRVLWYKVWQYRISIIFFRSVLILPCLSSTVQFFVLKSLASSFTFYINYAIHYCLHDYLFTYFFNTSIFHLFDSFILFPHVSFCSVYLLQMSSVFSIRSNVFPAAMV